MAASTRFSRLWLSMPPMIGRPSMTMVLRRSWVGTRLTRRIFPSDVVTQVGHQPALADLDILAFAPAVALDLIAVDLAHGKVLGLGMGERSEEHTSELQSRENLVCRLLLEKKNTITKT